MSALHYACVKGSMAEVKEAVKTCVCVDVPDSEGVTPFILATLASQFEVFVQSFIHSSKQASKQLIHESINH